MMLLAHMVQLNLVFSLPSTLMYSKLVVKKVQQAHVFESYPLLIF
jgi:hypothetical protein